MSAATRASSETSSASSERDESELERLDRNTVELLNELRVASTGIQVLFAFLLVVPFNTGFSKLSSFDRYVYFVTLLCIAVAAALLIAPSIHHRLLFRRKQKDYLVSMGTTLAIVAGGFLAVGMTGILVLISDVIFGGVTAGIVGVASAVVLAGLWFAMPLRRRRRP
jgi:cation transport ATPase